MFLASTVPEIPGGPKIPKVVQMAPMHVAPFDLILHFFLRTLPSVSLPNLKYLASAVREILGGRVPKFHNFVT